MKFTSHPNLLDFNSIRPSFIDRSSWPPRAFPFLIGDIQNPKLPRYLIDRTMGRSPCCDDSGLTKGHWTPEEDKKLKNYISKHGHGSWRALPKHAGLNRCGKSCRLRWTNYLRPDIKRGPFTDSEDEKIIHLHSRLGNKWSTIATELDGRTDNEIKNYWNTHLRKKLLQMGIDPVTHRPRADLTLLATIPNLLVAAAANLGTGLPSIFSLENSIRLQADSAQLAKEQFIQNLVQVLSNGYNINTSAGLPHPSDLIPSPPSPSSFPKDYTLPNDFQSMNQQLLLNNGNYNNYNSVNEIGECSTQQVNGFSDHLPIIQTPVSETFASIPTITAGAAIPHVPHHQSPSTLNVPSYNFDHQFNSLEDNLDRFGVGKSYSQMSSPCTNQTSTASIVSNSPDNLNVDQMHGLQNINTSTANSSTMNTADEDQPWGNTNFDDYLSTNFNWSDLLG